MKITVTKITITFLSSILLLTGYNNAADRSKEGLILIREQGSFAVGGIVVQERDIYDGNNFDNFKPYPEGQTYHGDHAYIYYQIPDHARNLPLVFLYGAGQSSKTWETTPDGREGF